MFHCCLEVINRRGLDPSNLVFDPPPQEKDSEVAIRGMQRPRDSWQSQNDSYSFDFYSFDSYSFEQWVVAPSCCQTLTWPVTDELLPARPDCEQIIKGIVTSMLTCPLLPSSISQPAPFHPWAKQTHVITVLFPISNMPPCLQDTLAPKRCHIFYYGLGWRGYHLSSLSRSGARRFCLQMVTILSTFWHPCRLEINQNQVDFVTVSKIGPC